MRLMIAVGALLLLFSCKKTSESIEYLTDFQRAILDKAYDEGDTIRFLYSKDQVTDTLIYQVSSKKSAFVSNLPVESTHTYHYEQVVVELVCQNKPQPITMAVGLREFDIPSGSYVSDRYFYLDLKEEFYKYNVSAMDTSSSQSYDFGLSGNFVSQDRKAKVRYSSQLGLEQVVDSTLGFSYTRIP
ncbi:MAG: hypothetical protein GC180_11575 [Bacteroidetes bacterium]|nr:hypothetical protein [Bacteroidota bacterium]